MAHPSIDFNDGLGHSHSYSLNNLNDNDENLSLSNSDDNQSRNVYSSIEINNDFESAIRNLRPLAVQQKKMKTNININKQQVDLPQLNHLNNESKSTQRWFPKIDVEHVNSDDFIRHNHVGSQQRSSDQPEQTIPPAVLTTNPPVGLANRPTAIVAQATSTQSISTLFSSNSSIKQATNHNHTDLHQSTQINSSSSAFQRIHPTENHHQQQQKSSLTKSIPLLMDIPQHKVLERGQQLTKVHISHPQSPSIVHLMLHEDFNTACRLLHDMALHPDLQIDQLPTQSFKAQVNRLCACYHEGRWFRCRILQISSDSSTATVVYLDWGMIMPMAIRPEYIRRLPNEFYSEPTCSILCHLDGVPETNDFISSDIIAQCIALLNENEYDVTVNGYDNTTGGKIVLSYNGRIVNDQIRQLLLPNTSMSVEEELVEQFRHELPLSIGDEIKALISSFSGKDDSFYILLVNEHTLAIDQAMKQLQDLHHSNRLKSEIPRIKTLVVARYADDGKWYRAWIKSICFDRQEALVFFVDYGNESTIRFADISTCPESVRSLPWLGIRVRLIDESMTHDELGDFWKLVQSNYIWMKILEIFQDSYGVQIKIDYTLILHYERMKLSMSNRSVDAAVQTMFNERCVSNQSDCRITTSPCLTEQNQMINENLIRNFFDMINKELRRLRHRLNDSDESSQDRHNQLIQLLFSTFNLNNSNSQKKQ